MSLLPLVLLIHAATAPTQAMTRVAVLDFEGQTTDVQILHRLTDVTRETLSGIASGKDLKVLSAEAINIGLSETNLDRLCSKGPCEALIGETLKADFVLTGTVSHSNGQAILNLQLHRTSDGLLLAQRSSASQHANRLGKRIKDN